MKAIATIFKSILQYFREFLIIGLSIALVIILLRCCEKDEVQTLIVDEVPVVKDSIIYVPTGDDSILRIQMKNDMDSLGLILSSYRRQIHQKDVKVSEIKEKGVKSLKLGPDETLMERVQEYYDECLRIQDQLYQGNFYSDTLRNDSIFVHLIEEVAENKIQHRKLVARFTLTRQKKRLQLYLGMSGGYGSRGGAFGFHIYMQPRKQKFMIGYFNQSTFPNFTNTHNITVLFRIRK